MAFSSIFDARRFLRPWRMRLARGRYGNPSRSTVWRSAAWEPVALHGAGRECSGNSPWRLNFTGRWRWLMLSPRRPNRLRADRAQRSWAYWCCCRQGARDIDPSEARSMRWARLPAGLYIFFDRRPGIGVAVPRSSPAAVAIRGDPCQTPIGIADGGGPNVPSRL